MNRSLIAIPAAIAVTVFTLGISTPAFAQVDACSAAPGALRAAAAAVDTSVAKKALGNIATGEKLCEAGNELAASRKFKVAAKALNVDYATLKAPVAAAK